MNVTRRRRTSLIKPRWIWWVVPAWSGAMRSDGLHQEVPAGATVCTLARAGAHLVLLDDGKRPIPLVRVGL